MSSSGRDNLSRRTHTFVPGVGQVPVGPRSATASASTQEERRSLEQSWSPPAQRHGSYHPNLSPAAHALRPNDRAQSWSSWSTPSPRATSDDLSSSEDERNYRMRDYGREQGRGSRQRSRSPVPNHLNSDPNRNLFSRRGHVLADYEESLVSAGADDEFVVTPPYVHVQPRPSRSCICPIGNLCECRAVSGKIDCRPPVPPPKHWSEGETETIARLSRNLTTDEVRVVAKLKRLEHYYKRLRIEHSRKAVCEDIEQWGRDVQLVGFVITEGLLIQSQVLVALKEFLNNTHHNIQRAREQYPSLVEDLTYLIRKWGRGDLDNDPSRGLIRKVRQNGIAFWVVDKDWEHYTSADDFGDNGLVTGQRWPGRAHMMRDGAHSTPESGISGTIKKGARSLVMGLHGQIKREYYADRDYALCDGEWVRYNGTAKTGHDDEDEGGPKYSIHTRMLLTSINTQRPVRLFRSDKLPYINELRPEQGYRYDGLYHVVDYEIIEEERGILGFNLRRLIGQRPVRKHDQRSFAETS